MTLFPCYKRLFYMYGILILIFILVNSKEFLVLLFLFQYYLHKILYCIHLRDFLSCISWTDQWYDILDFGSLKGRDSFSREANASLPYYILFIDLHLLFFSFHYSFSLSLDQLKEFLPRHTFLFSLACTEIKRVSTPLLQFLLLTLIYRHPCITDNTFCVWNICY